MRSTPKRRSSSTTTLRCPLPIASASIARGSTISTGRRLARFKKPFAELTTADADVIVKPLFKVRGAMMSVVDLGPFINRVHQDVRTVTINSPQWAAAQVAGAVPVLRLLYWRKVDPTVPLESFAPWQPKTTRS